MLGDDNLSACQNVLSLGIKNLTPLDAPQVSAVGAVDHPSARLGVPKPHDITSTLFLPRLHVYLGMALGILMDFSPKPTHILQNANRNDLAVQCLGGGGSVRL